MLWKWLLAIGTGFGLTFAAGDPHAQLAYGVSVGAVVMARFVFPLFPNFRRKSTGAIMLVIMLLKNFAEQAGLVPDTSIVAIAPHYADVAAVALAGWGFKSLAAVLLQAALDWFTTTGAHSGPKNLVELARDGRAGV